MDRKGFDHIAGCLLGGAAGDALGAPVEFMGLAQIRSRYGPAGITDMREAVGKDSEGLARFTDDTQMTLFTAEGLLRAGNRMAERGDPATAAVVHNAYFRWLYTQGSGTGGLEGQVDGWLITNPRPLRHPRARAHLHVRAAVGRHGDAGGAGQQQQGLRRGHAGGPGRAALPSRRGLRHRVRHRGPHPRPPQRLPGGGLPGLGGLVHHRGGFTG